MLQRGRAESGNITVATIASVANITMAINPRFEAHHRSESTDGLWNASRDRRCKPDMAALLSDRGTFVIEDRHVNAADGRRV
jgi:hypothetical protein